MSKGEMKLHTRLDTKVIHASSPGDRPLHWFKLPGLGHLLLTRDRSARALPNDLYLQTHLLAHHRDGDNKTKDIYDLGPGLTTEGFAMALAAEVTTSVAVFNNTNNSLKWMSTGTSTTAATAYDYKLGTQDAYTPVAATITPGITANNATLQFVGTISYTGTEAVTEWALSNQSGGTAAISTATSPAFTATGVTSGFSGLTASADINYMLINSTTPAGGAITANTTSAATIQSWASLTSGGGVASTPSSGTTAIYPLMADHKVFSAINVVSGDSIQFTYTLTLQSGN